MSSSSCDEGRGSIGIVKRSLSKKMVLDGSAAEPLYPGIGLLRRLRTNTSPRAGTSHQSP